MAKRKIRTQKQLITWSDLLFKLHKQKQEEEEEEEEEEDVTTKD